MSEEISEKHQNVIDRIMCNDPSLTCARFDGKCIHLHDAAATC